MFVNKQSILAIYVFLVRHRQVQNRVQSGGRYRIRKPSLCVLRIVHGSHVQPVRISRLRVVVVIVVIVVIVHVHDGSNHTYTHCHRDSIAIQTLIVECLDRLLCIGAVRIRHCSGSLELTPFVLIVVATLKWFSLSVSMSIDTMFGTLPKSFSNTSRSTEGSNPPKNTWVASGDFGKRILPTSNVTGAGVIPKYTC